MRESEIEKMECTEWLKIKLGDGEYHLCDDIRDEAKRRGYKMADFKQARKEIGVKTFHQFDEYGPTQNYFWYLEDL